MLEILSFTKKGIQEIKFAKKNCWINLYNPTENDLLKISKILKLKEKDYKDLKKDIDSISDDYEIPLFEQKKYNVDFFIIKTPQEATGSFDQDYMTIPLGLILTNSLVITISYRKNNVISRMKTKNLTFSPIYFTLRLFLAISKSYLYYLKLIDKRLRKIEASLESKQSNEEMSNLLDIQKSLVFFNTSIINNQILFEKISRHDYFTKDEENKEIMQEILDENRQAMQTTQIYSDNIKHTLNVISSMISNNLNRIVKFLTSVSIIIAIPTLVASLYGMNVLLPFQNDPFAFTLIMIMSIIISVGIGLFLWHKKLF
jgi:magnesium transporter